MDNRILGIFNSLLANVETLDHTLLTLSRSELVGDSEECLGLIEKIREACISTLHSLLSVELQIQGSAFVIPDDGDTAAT